MSSAPFNDNIAISSSSGGEREAGFGGKDGYACYHAAGGRSEALELLSVMEETTVEINFRKDVLSLHSIW